MNSRPSAPAATLKAMFGRPTTFAMMLSLAAGCATTLQPPEPVTAGTAHSRLREATVTLIDKRGRGFCTGSFVETSEFVVTAAHCLKRGDEVLLRDSRGARHRAVAVDKVPTHDIALLRLERASDLRALPLGGAVSPGTRVWFLGRPYRHRRVQDARVRK
ncbi:MAG: S1-C subfamily serine protease, partial [Myxococcota bacterium]